MLTLNDLFDEFYYLGRNPDVAAGVANGAIASGFNHFQIFGSVEGRNPSAFFDTQYYLAQNPDAAASVASFDFTASEHFLEFGQFQGRVTTPFFDRNFYRQNNPDVANAVDRDLIMGEFEHFVKFGAKEGRSPNLFLDTNYYLQTNPDVANAVNQGIFTGFEHFVGFGQFEGRNSHPLLDANFYLNTNPDVRNAVNQGITTAFKHFTEAGQFEGRNPSPFFDTAFYLGRNPDVAAAVQMQNFLGRQLSASEHFIKFGQSEGRIPRILFSQMYVFGDSLSDNGNTFAATGGLIPPSPPYFNGRASNGPVWVETLAPALGLVDNPSNNRAFTGALSGNLNTQNLAFPQLPPLPGLQGSVNDFVAANPAADPNGLYVVWAGANDYLSGRETNPAVVVNNLTTAVNNLAAVGARNFILPNLPDLGNTPRAREQTAAAQQRLTLLANGHNSALTGAIANLEQNLNINIIPLDVKTLVDDAIANPSQFGFTNVTSNFLQSGATNANQFLFWDDVHPTNPGHNLIADLARKAITNIPELTSLRI